MPFSFRALTPGSGEIIVERPGEAQGGPERPCYKKHELSF